MSKNPRRRDRTARPSTNRHVARRDAKASVTKPGVVAHAGDEIARRIDAVDALRGTAICMMIAYHAAFDLNWFHIISTDFNHHPFWLASRDLIVSSFLVLVGVSLVLARRAGISIQRFWRRIAVVGGCALLVTLGSYAAFPRTYITFGILHCIVVSSILAWPLVRLPRIASIIGVLLIVAGAAIGPALLDPAPFPGLSLFDFPWLNWVGLMTHRPETEDYVPLLPWFGLVLLGIGLGAWLLERLPGVQRMSRVSPEWLTWLGRHSLIVYMVHQPVMIGLLRVLHG